VSRSGAIKSWNADRGFGFIQPHDGGADLFVHISELPRGGSPPVVGEQVFFELGRGKDGRIQAVKVWRKGEDHSPRPAKSRRRSSRSRWGSGAVILVVLGVVSLNAYQKRQQSIHAPLPLSEHSAIEEPAPRTDFQCDGRTHCTHMTSCEEAKYFIQNCPNTEMDGDHDGVPCERQWCTGWN
jgi:cold shock CspA family protein